MVRRSKKPHLLLLSTLFPSPGNPRHGLFVERRFRHLLASGQVTGEVCAPVSRRPLGAVPGGPAVVDRDGLRVAHPTWTAIPKLGRVTNPGAILRAARRALVEREGPRIDLVDGHYLFPDGVATARLAAELGVPFLLTARGSDVNLHLEDPLVRRPLRRALDAAAAVVCVSSSLRDRLAEFGVPAARLHVLRNGVDAAAFRPVEPIERSSLGFATPPRQLLLMVGGLTPVKGFDLAIRALARLPDDVGLVIVGEGPDHDQLERLAVELGVAGRVRLLGPRAPADLPPLYSAADALWMASRREGLPNVVLEAMACGTPVCGVAVGGVAEVVDRPEVGILEPDNQPESLARAARATLAAGMDRGRIRAHALTLSWDATTQGQLALIREALG